MRALAEVLWTPSGARRLPSERQLGPAIAALSPEDVWWVAEASSAGPVYLMPTKEWLRALLRFIEAMGAKSVLEIAAGDGFLSACVAKARPSLKVRATDNHAWARLAARLSPEEARRGAGLGLSGIRIPASVERLSASAAIARYRPDLVLVSWAPPGLLVERAIRAPSKLVLDLSVEGDVCGNDARTWRFRKELLGGPLEARAFCRLDGKGRPRQTRATLYYGARHRLHGLE
jgi:hypothetical protein